VNVDEWTVFALNPLKDWCNVALGPMLASEFTCHVFIENDTNLAAQGEFYRVTAQGENNFVFIVIGEEVGASIFVGVSIHRGPQ